MIIGPSVSFVYVAVADLHSPSLATIHLVFVMIKQIKMAVKESICERGGSVGYET